MREGRQFRAHGGRLLFAAIRSPGSLTQLSKPDWNLLLRLAHRNRLLGRLAEAMDVLDVFDQIPSKAAEILRSTQVLIRHRQRQALWELDRLAWALADTRVRPVALKGAAYLLADLALSRGRLMADVDLMVPRERIAEIEQALRGRGWISQKQTTYDQRYYREWMHELPPVRHREREIEVDLHHTILPLTSRLNPQAGLLFEWAKEIPNTGYRLLSPPDMVLHSATHLFHDGQIAGGLRDLVDIHELLTDFSAQATFWSDLLARAATLDLTRPLFYALRFSNKFLGTSIPPEVLSDRCDFRPNPLARAFMDASVTRVLARHHPESPNGSLSQWLLFVRSHWLRMPPRLLIPHLVRKTWKRINPKALT